MNSGIHFWKGLALCVGFSCVIVLTKEKLGIAFYIFLCWEKYTQKKNTCWKGKTGWHRATMRLPDPEPRLAPSGRSFSPRTSSSGRRQWQSQRPLANTEVLRTTDQYSSACATRSRASNRCQILIVSISVILKQRLIQQQWRLGGGMDGWMDVNG